MAAGDEERLAEMRRLAVDLALNGDTEKAKEVTALGKAMEAQIEREKKKDCGDPSCASSVTHSAANDRPGR